MSADAYADKSGTFTIEVRDYVTGRSLGVVRVHAESFAPFIVEIMDGTYYLPFEARAINEERRKRA